MSARYSISLLFAERSFSSTTLTGTMPGAAARGAETVPAGCADFSRKALTSVLVIKSIPANAERATPDASIKPIASAENNVSPVQATVTASCLVAATVRLAGESGAVRVAAAAAGLAGRAAVVIASASSL